MADNRYGRGDDWRGPDERNRMDRDRVYGRGGMTDHDRSDDDRNFAGAHRGNRSYFEESYGPQERGERSRGGFFGGRDRDDDRGYGMSSSDRDRDDTGGPGIRRSDERGSRFGSGLSSRQSGYVQGEYSSGAQSGYGQGGMPGQSGHGDQQSGYQSFAQGGRFDQERHRDEEYYALRERHIRDFDRQYEEFRRHQQDRHAAEFEEWRRSRGQSDPARQVREHMEVVGSDGQHVGVVDNVEGDRIKLARKDPAAGGQHHYIDASLVRSVEGNSVQLRQSADEAKRAWQAEETGAGYGGAGIATDTTTAAGASGLGTDQSGRAGTRPTRK